MTNKELKKKIMETIDNSVDDWAIRDKRGRIHVYIEKIADALIAAGIGDVKRHRVFVSKDGKEIKQLYNGEEVEQIVKEREEYKHRAEVAEKALYCLARSFAEAMCKDGDTQHITDGFIDDAYKQAKKELAEEGKDGNKTD